MPDIDACRVFALPQILLPQGNLTPVTGSADVPFPIARVFYLYDIPGGAARGGHAHHQCEQLLVCAMGSFRVALDDGRYRRTVSLDRAYYGLYVPPLVWAEEFDFSAGAICLVLASREFEEDDYIRDYEEFVALKQSRTAAATNSTSAADSSG